MDYISVVTNNKMSKLFHKPLQDAIYTNLGLVLLYKIDLRNTNRLPDFDSNIYNTKSFSGHTLPIIEDFIRLILDKNLKTTFWNIFNYIQLNEKEFILYDLELFETAHHLGKEYLSKRDSFEEIDLNLAREIFFNYMLATYFNVTALGSINKLNLEWANHLPLIKQFQSQIISKYLSIYQPKKLRAMKVDAEEEIFEVSEYVD